MMVDRDVVVVGGGIAGSALAAVLAREGLDVEVLERQERYTDHVRGENLHPWGVAETQRLGLYDVLVAAGGHVVEAYVDHGDGDGDPSTLRITDLVAGAPGELNLGQPEACEALAATAEASGATVVRGVTHVEVTAGPCPSVSYALGGKHRTLTCRLVVGADGRSSRVRHQAGIVLERAAGTHLVTGLLVDGLDVDPRHNVIATGEDVWMVTFPRGEGRARVYLCPGTEEPQRFAGSDGPERFLRASAVDAVPHRDAWLAAVPAGPCRTFPADDTWTERPFAHGVVLIGDAGGYNDPLIGQGLALALRDVRALSELLLNGAAWDLDAFARYGSERAERLRRMRFIGRLHATVWTTFGPEGRELRRSVAQRKREDPSLLAAAVAISTGPDRLDPALCTERFLHRYLGASVAA